MLRAFFWAYVLLLVFQPQPARPIFRPTRGTLNSGCPQGYRCLPNGPNLQRGYDITNGESVAFALGLEWGTDQYCNPYDGVCYLIPNGTTVGTVDKSTDETYNLFESVDSTTLWQAVQVSERYKAGMYSYSSMTNASIISINEQSKNTAYERKTYLGQYVVIPRSRMVLSEECQYNLALLPNVYDYNMYRQFMQSYGTHVSNYSQLGGRYTFVSDVDTCYIYQSGTTTTQTQVQTDGWIHSDEHTTYTGYTQTDSYYQTHSVTRQTFVGGDSAYHYSSTWDAWWNSLELMVNPDMVTYTLVPLYTLIDDPIKRANMEQAYEDYLQEAYQIQNQMVTAAQYGPRDVTYVIAQTAFYSGTSKPYTQYVVPSTTVQLAAGESSPIFGVDGTCDNLHKYSMPGSNSGKPYTYYTYGTGLAQCRRFSDGKLRAQTYFNGAAWTSSVRSNGDDCTSVTVDVTSGDAPDVTQHYGWNWSGSAWYGTEYNMSNSGTNFERYASELYEVNYWTNDPGYGWHYNQATSTSGLNVTTGYSMGTSTGYLPASGGSPGTYVICYFDCRHVIVAFDGKYGMPTVQCTC